ncbi:MAG TPA: ClpXP protease specificity-enhancing factor [Salinisphaeraceae bacterium]|nr:ClpXP protease specificity-enhancing factor [Salinisphaeraceae bacterium]
MVQISSRRPYLIRALHEWALDNNLTPHLLIAANAPGVDVPSQFVTDEGRITINISPSAVRDLSLGNDWITFSARFSGRGYNINIPPGAVLALYARENGEGMMFGEVETPPQPASQTDDGAAADDSNDKPRPSHLRVVK